MNSTRNERTDDRIREGEAAYKHWHDRLWAEPDFRAIYEQEAAKRELWLPTGSSEEGRL